MSSGDRLKGVGEEVNDVDRMFRNEFEMVKCLDHNKIAK
jgi:hypothetical protein